MRMEHSIFDIIEKKKKELGIKEVDLDNYAQKRVNDYNSMLGHLNERDGFDCPKCLNKGHVIYLNEKGDEVFRDCECMSKRLTIVKMQKSGLKNIISEYTFDKFIAEEDWQKAIKQQAINFVSEYKSSWFFLGGQPGAGKTHLCTAICRELLLKDINVKYMLWKEDSTAIKGAITDYEKYHSLIDPLKRTEVLYIDDFFKPISDKGVILPPTAADINLAFELLDYRKNAKLTTIISSERLVKDIVDIDEATGSRIVEMASRMYRLGISKDRNKNQRIK